MAISMLKIRRPLGRLIFNMGIAIPGKTVFLIETAPRSSYQIVHKCAPGDFTNDKSTLVHAMAWCRRATSHYLRQRRGHNESTNMDFNVEFPNNVNTAHVANIL